MISGKGICIGIGFSRRKGCNIVAIPLGVIRVTSNLSRFNLRLVYLMHQSIWYISLLTTTCAFSSMLLFQSLLLLHKFPNPYWDPFKKLLTRKVRLQAGSPISLTSTTTIVHTDI